jgi:hypothetical protein
MASSSPFEKVQHPDKDIYRFDKWVYSRHCIISKFRNNVLLATDLSERVILNSVQLKCPVFADTLELVLEMGVIISQRGRAPIYLRA